MDVLFAPYELKKVSGGSVEGTLVKVVQDNYWGVADLCPHPSLGDSTWISEIKNEGSLFKRAYQLATEDLTARKNKVSLLQDKKIQNNFLVTDFSLAELNRQEFSGQTVKIKGDNRTAKLAEVLNGITLNVTIRLDFNAKLSSEEFGKFLSLLSDSARNKIQYIEDPTVIGPEWKKWNIIIPLASDWQKTSDRSLAKYKIVKPSREEIPEDKTNCTFTSAMDHAVGVAHGLRLAQKYSVNVSGFLTLDLYQPSLFNKYFVTSGSRLNFSESALRDYGIGMTEELNKLSWQSATELM